MAACNNACWSLGASRTSLHTPFPEAGAQGCAALGATPGKACGLVCWRESRAGSSQQLLRRLQTLEVAQLSRCSCSSGGSAAAVQGARRLCCGVAIIPLQSIPRLNVCVVSRVGGVPLQQLSKAVPQHSTATTPPGLDRFRARRTRAGAVAPQRPCRVFHMNFGRITAQDWSGKLTIASRHAGEVALQQPGDAMAPYATPILERLVPVLQSPRGAVPSSLVDNSAITLGRVGSPLGLGNGQGLRGLDGLSTAKATSSARSWTLSLLECAEDEGSGCGSAIGAPVLSSTSVRMFSCHRSSAGRRLARPFYRSRLRRA